MMLKVAWRNIWRNRTRSAVVITAIAIGLWAGVFASAFVVGMMNQKVESVMQLELSHIQVHHPEFRDEMLPKFTISQKENILNEIRNNENVKSLSARVIAMPMISSAAKSGTIKVTGINPDEESQVTILSQYMEEGKYFEGIKKNPILISRKTAEEYKVKLRSKVVLTAQDIDGEITAMAFRVVGIFDSKNSMYDGMNAFAKREDLQKLLGLNDEIHEVAILLNQHDLADPVSQNLQSKWENLEIKPWMDLAAGMRFMVDAMDTYTMVIVGIILVALLFSIINTMLMAVLERIREIGMLMAIGMSKMRVFGMIMLETISLSLIGGPIGLLLAWGSIKYFGKNGIDLGNAAYGDLGFSNIIYPQLDPASYFNVTVMVIVMSVLAAIYPARKAIKLIPVEAIRKI